MAKTNATTPEQPPQGSGNNVPNVQNMYPQSVPPSVNAATTVPPFPQAVNTGNSGNSYGGMNNVPNFPQPLPQMQGGQMNLPANPMSQPPSTVPSPEQLQQQVQIIQMLQAQGVPQEQWAPVLSVLMAAGNNAGAGPAPAAQQNFSQTQFGGRDDQSRDRNGYGDQYDMRSPPGRNRRSRSRSPSGYDRRRDPSPRRRRDSPSYGRGDDRSGRAGGNPYRQRSPDRYRRSNSPRGRELPLPGPKSISYDHSMPPNHIRGILFCVFGSQP